jgi:hypothetical protein
MKRYDLNVPTIAFRLRLLAFFGGFLFYPISLLLREAFICRKAPLRPPAPVATFRC